MSVLKIGVVGLGDMALHELEIMEGMLVSAHEHRFYDMQTTFALPPPLHR